MITDRVADMVGVFLAFVPRLISAILVLLIGYIVAKLIAAGVRKALQAIHLDDRVRDSDVGQTVERVTTAPSKFISKTVYWLLYLSVVALAASVLNIELLNSFLAAVYAYLPNVLAALLIFAVATGFSALISATVGRAMGDTSTGKIVVAAVPAITMTIAVFMILSQLGIARDIVNIAFASVMGAVALGMALAFGLGGRDVAARLLEGAYDKGREGVSQARQDIAQARERAQEAAPEMASDVGQMPASRPAFDAHPTFGETLRPEDLED